MWGLWRHFQWAHEIENFFGYDAEMLLACFTLPSHEDIVSQSLHEVWYRSRLNAEVDGRTQLPFMNVDVKEIYKDAKQCLS